MHRPAVLFAVLVVLAGCVRAPVAAPSDTSSPPDPGADPLGWEAGYWYNESLSVSGDDLNETELTTVVRRAMARVEHIRRMEFRQSVPVEIISRRTYREEHVDTANRSAALVTFDNTKFEALFLTGETRSSLAQQSENRGRSVQGFYSPSSNRIVIISEAGSRTIRETTLGHELVHALQFQHFDAEYDRSTRDRANAIAGLIEGSASYVGGVYRAKCGQEWSCLSPSTRPRDAAENSTDETGDDGFHFGIAILTFFPYSDGPGFVTHIRQNGGWDRVSDLYEAPPATAEQVAVPTKYGDDHPANVSLADRSDRVWKRVTVSGRAPYGEVGVSGLTAMFAWPTYHEERDGDGTNDGVLSPQAFRTDQPEGGVNVDPFNYTSPPVEGWEGDRLYIYEHGDGANAYVWKLMWESPQDAREFVSTYRELLQYWGGERVALADRDTVWRIDTGPYADAFYVRVEGATVVVVNAPTLSQLDDVHTGNPPIRTLDVPDNTRF